MFQMLFREHSLNDEALSESPNDTLNDPPSCLNASFTNDSECGFLLPLFVKCKEILTVFNKKSNGINSHEPLIFSQVAKKKKTQFFVAHVLILVTAMRLFYASNENEVFCLSLSLSQRDEVFENGLCIN